MLHVSMFHYKVKNFLELLVVFDVFDCPPVFLIAAEEYVGTKKILAMCEWWLYCHF